MHIAFEKTRDNGMQEWLLSKKFSNVNIQKIFKSGYDTYNLFIQTYCSDCFRQVKKDTTQKQQLLLRVDTELDRGTTPNCSYYASVVTVFQIFKIVCSSRVISGLLPKFANKDGVN